MQRIRILTANAGALGDQLEDAVFAHGPDVVALTGIGPARALRLAAPRSMRAATQSWSGENAGLALLWKAGLAVGSLDRFDFGHSGEPHGALRISFPLDGRQVSVYCSSLSSEHTVPTRPLTRLAELIDAARQPSLAACEGAGTDAGAWSRCADAWTAAQRRVVTLAATSDAGLAVRQAFGIAREAAPVYGRSQAGPIWLCSEEFSVIESRSIAVAGAPDRLVWTATVALRASAADENVAIAL